MSPLNTEIYTKTKLDTPKIKKEESKSINENEINKEKNEKVIKIDLEPIKNQQIAELDIESRAFSSKSSKAITIKNDLNKSKDVKSVFNFNFDEKECIDIRNKTFNSSISIRNTKDKIVRQSSSQNEDDVSPRRFESKVRKTLLQTITEGIKSSHQVTHNKPKLAIVKNEEKKEIVKGKVEFVS